MNDSSWTEQLLVAADRQRTTGDPRDFWAIVSHELRAPLAAIQGYTGLLASGRPGPLNPRQREFLAGAEGELRNLHRRLECLLAACRLLFAATAAAAEPTSLNGLVAGVLQPLAEAAAARGVRLESSIDESQDRATIDIIGAARADVADLDVFLVALGLQFECRGCVLVGHAAGEMKRRLEVALPEREPERERSSDARR